MAAMKIELYRTVLCPRCLYVSRVLQKIAAEQPGIAIEAIEVATNLERARAAGIRTVPTLKIGGDRLSGLFLTPTAIRRFVAGHPDIPAERRPATAGEGSESAG
jgi:predicted DsbA family dithiol-disulfide isomerase